jgi:uncharacterized protein YlxP (DUF503 family)
MHVLRLTVRVTLSDCGGARDRDTRLAAIAGRLRWHFNVAVAHGGVPGSETEGWLALVTIAAKPRDARRTLEEVAEALAAHPDCRLAAPPELTSL